MQSRVELKQENQRIQGELAQAHEALLEKESVLEKKEAFIEQLKEALILARNARFASSSEAFRFAQQDLFNEAEQEVEGGDSTDSLDADEGNRGDDTVTVEAHQRCRRGRKALPPELPRVEVIYDLSDEDKVCPHDGHELIAISEKISEQLDIVPMQIQVIRHIRKHYTCPCCDGYLKTASKPKQPIAKSQASAGLLAYIAVSKYTDGLPLYRQSTILSRFGIKMDRTTLSNWMIRCGQLVQPLINRIEEQLLMAPIIHMDETPVQVLKESGRQPNQNLICGCAVPVPLGDG